MGIVDYLIIVGLFVMCGFILYHSLWKKKGHCQGCSCDSSSCDSKPTTPKGKA